MAHLVREPLTPGTQKGSDDNEIGNIRSASDEAKASPRRAHAINQKPIQVFIKLEQLPPGALYPAIVWGNLTSENTRHPKSLRLSAGTAGPLRRAVRRWANRDRPIDRARRTRPRPRRSSPFALRRIDCRALAH